MYIYSACRGHNPNSRTIANQTVQNNSDCGCAGMYVDVEPAPKWQEVICPGNSAQSKYVLVLEHPCKSLSFLSKPFQEHHENKWDSL